MATYNNGTAGNDTKVGVATEKNSFLGFGLGSDTLTGGNLDDTFSLFIDANVDEIDGGKGGRDLVDFGFSYKTHQSGLIINLALGEVRAQFGDQWRLTTVLRSIEDATGSISTTRSPARTATTRSTAARATTPFRAVAATTS